MTNLNWNTCGNQGSWCGFLSVDLGHSHFDGMEGVYIIWQGNGPIIKVGQGTVKDRLASHRNDRRITAYDNLYATWANVSAKYRDGIERYLADRLRPRVGDTYPDANPIAVNLPWPFN